MTINGPGAGLLTVSGQNSVRVFQIDAGVTAEIDGIAVANGRAPDGSPGANAVTTPTAGSGGTGGDGGGILNLGTLTLKQDSIVNNVAGNGGSGGTGAQGVTGTRPVLGPPGGTGGMGGQGGDGGAIYSSNSLTLVQDTLLGNHAGAGGFGGRAGPGPPAEISIPGHQAATVDRAGPAEPEAQSIPRAHSR